MIYIYIYIYICIYIYIYIYTHTHIHTLCACLSGRPSAASVSWAAYKKPHQTIDNTQLFNDD